MTVNFTKCSYRCTVMLLTLSLTIISIFARAQGTTDARVIISGTVKDGGNGETLPGVSISISDAKNGTITNVDGVFTIKANIGSTLTFRIVGYIPSTVKIKGPDTKVDVLMKRDKTDLKDVVVIGYQEVSRKNVTASVTSVNPKTMLDVPAPTLDALLQGRAPGLDVQNFSGEPGVRSNVVMRGNTAVSRNINSDFTSADGKASLARALSGPLYVIDGVPQNTDDIAAIMYGSGTNTDALAGIPVSDIASIDILKDASAAAIYGSRGAGGVIIITTKRGTSGKPKVEFSTYHGLTDQPSLDKVLIGAEERRAKMALIQHYGSYNNLTYIPQILTDSLNPAFNNANDYESQLFRTGKVDNYDISVNGGSDLINYRYSLNYYDEEGIIKKSGFKRYSFSGSTGLNISPKLNVTTQIRFSRGDRPISISDVSGGYGPFNGATDWKRNNLH